MTPDPRQSDRRTADSSVWVDRRQSQRRAPPVVDKVDIYQATARVIRHIRWGNVTKQITGEML